jgi:hypothetical protein
MIKSTGYIGLKICWVILLMMLLAGCPNRCEPPVLNPDGTLLYALKDGRALLSGISFYKLTDGETGLPIGVDTVFTLSDVHHLRARVPLIDPDTRVPMFHLDWTGPGQQSFFMKPAEIFADSVTAYLYSTISLSPAKREPGKYMLRVYYFRELVAKKSVVLLPEESINSPLAVKLKPAITFFSKLNKTTGERLGEDTVFQMGKNARVRAYADLINVNGVSDSKLLFDLVWRGPDGEKFYSKGIELSSDEDDARLYSSISIPPEKREPGKYALEVYLFDEMIAEKKFRLK